MSAALRSLRASRRPLSWPLGLALVLPLAAIDAAGAQSREFACSEGSALTLSVEDADTITAQLGSGDPARLRMADTPLSYASTRLELKLSRNQRSVRLTRPDGEDIVCIHLPAGAGDGGGDVAGLEARSFGGVVRDGPGMEFERLAALQEGDGIVLLERTDQSMNDYPWFRITFGQERTGYQWGGLICSVGRPVAGTLQECD